VRHQATLDRASNIESQKPKYRDAEKENRGLCDVVMSASEIVNPYEWLTVKFTRSLT